MSPEISKMSPELVDQAILACCRPQSLKVARIIGHAAEALKVPYPEATTRTGFKFIAKRIKALVKAKKLVGAGDLDGWGTSEIRLPGK
jgi:hypothetical protein